MNLVTQAATRLVQRRFLLHEDKERIVEEAEAKGVGLWKTPELSLKVGGERIDASLTAHHSISQPSGLKQRWADGLPTHHC